MNNNWPGKSGQHSLLSLIAFPGKNACPLQRQHNTHSVAGICQLGSLQKRPKGIAQTLRWKLKPSVRSLDFSYSTFKFFNHKATHYKICSIFHLYSKLLSSTLFPWNHYWTIMKPYFPWKQMETNIKPFVNLCKPTVSWDAGPKTYRNFIDPFSVHSKPEG